MGRPKIKIIDDSQLETSSVILNKAKRSEESTKVNDSDKLTASSAMPQNDKGEDEPKKSQKPGKTTKVRSKKYKQSLLFFGKKSQEAEELDRGKQYSITEAIDMVKKLSYSKFIGSIDAHINTNQTNLRGLVSLPFISGKKLTILAFGLTSSKDFAGLEGVIVGDDSSIEEINKGKINFDILVTTPDWMGKLAKVARILGPRGLMPNPKNGTIADDLKKVVEGFQTGKTEYKTENKAPVIHISLGKLSQPTEELSANVKTLIQTLGKLRVQKVSLSPTMGPSVKVDLASI